MNARSLVLVALIAPAFLALAACSKSEAPPPGADTPRAVPFAMVARQPLGAGISVNGRLVAREEAAVSSQLSGYLVARVLVDQDALVRAGQPLAELDATLLRADIAQSRAALAQTRVAADKAEQEASRVTALDHTGVLSDEAIAQRRLAARTAHAQVDQSQAQLSAQLVKQGLMVVRAPVSGRILTRTVRPGDVASPSTVMFTMARDDRAELDAEIPEELLGGIHAGDHARVRLASGRWVDGTVRLVAAQVDAQTRLGRARILLPVDREIRPGGYARAELAGKPVPVLAVPEAAVSYDGNGASVTVIEPGDKVRRVAVKTGTRGGGMIELTQGPAAGTRVLTGSQDFVLDGEKVQPVRKGN
ncbi:efflux RND transporter periplasmic adaptor subunit [Novosphingobium humi]|uniref:efflux RND transporter periplasmic adaptor subunit n=1 Tax=Novosphingobium humi TaxID=2282397 RepID=UPI0025B1F591|nr:efflux RND transporter periplasmic adaptor subunit [Novosphingobium humi]WJS97200.1 efflux RND transporter periplasmic adaptor subunit [Novosphingobium humi]